MLGRPIRGIIQKRDKPGDESEFNAIDIEFFVVKRGFIQRRKQIINLFVNRGFLTMLLLLQSSSSSSLSVEVVAKHWTDGRMATTIGATS
jgi:hypothetical protein